MPGKTYWVYILTNRSGTLYIGVTNNVERRLAEHAAAGGGGRSFTARYKLDRLIYVEAYAEARDAIAREKQLKGWRRTKKVALINRVNPGWRDLQETSAGPSPRTPS
jgi:putative endonuclease